MNAAREHLARVAYAAYGDARGWVTFDGDPMPPWEEQSEDIREAWVAAAAAVAEVAL